MQAAKTLHKLHTDNAGVSLIFVLASMLFLMAVCASLLVAASTNVGYRVTQWEHSQVGILEDSIHQNIMYSLQSDPADVDGMAYQLAMALYEAKDSRFFTTGIAPGLSDDTKIEIEINGNPLTSGIVSFSEAKLSFPEQNVAILPEIPAVWWEEYLRLPDPDDFVSMADLEDFFDDAEVSISPGYMDELWEEIKDGKLVEGDILKDEDGNAIIEFYRMIVPRTPCEAYVNASMVITVKCQVQDRNDPTRSRTITSRTSYEYMGGYLSDDPDGAGYIAYAADLAGMTDVDAWRDNPVLKPDVYIDNIYLEGNPFKPEKMDLINIGEWRLISYENVDAVR